MPKDMMAVGAMLDWRESRLPPVQNTPPVKVSRTTRATHRAAEMNSFLCTSCFTRFMSAPPNPFSG